MDTLNLFDTPSAETNLLPYDGTVNDFGTILPPGQADVYFERLLGGVPWRHDEAVMFGKHITTARKTAWYGDCAFAYAYSGITRTAQPWCGTLLEIKQKVERHIAAVCPAVFNSCLLNLYSDGLEGMAWHSDNEKELGSNPVIASLSLGATRKFAFKHKHTREKREIMLDHGRLIVMRGETQNHWLHAVMRSSRVCEARISLTFRTILPAYPQPERQAV